MFLFTQQIIKLSDFMMESGYFLSLFMTVVNVAAVTYNMLMFKTRDFNSLETNRS